MNTLPTRLFIRQILRESLILEAQKLSGVNRAINDFFNNCKFYLSGEEISSQIALKEIKEECIIKANSFIREIQNNNFPYENLYVVKFGNFFIKSAGKYLPLTFELQQEKAEIFKNFTTSFVALIYHDLLFKLIPYNEKFATDALLTKEAQVIMGSNEFKNIFSTQKQSVKMIGEIKIMDFDKKNLIITNYFNNLSYQKPSQDANKPSVKMKKSFRPNTPLVHKVFGKGIIKSAKKIKEDIEGTIYNIIVNFPVVGTKTIQVKVAS